MRIKQAKTRIRIAPPNDGFGRTASNDKNADYGARFWINRIRVYDV